MSNLAQTDFLYCQWLLYRQFCRFKLGVVARNSKKGLFTTKLCVTGNQKPWWWFCFFFSRYFSSFSGDACREQDLQHLFRNSAPQIQTDENQHYTYCRKYQIKMGTCTQFSKAWSGCPKNIPLGLSRQTIKRIIWYFF